MLSVAIGFSEPRLEIRTATRRGTAMAPEGFEGEGGEIRWVLGFDDPCEAIVGDSAEELEHALFGKLRWLFGEAKHQ